MPHIARPPPRPPALLLSVVLSAVAAAAAPAQVRVAPAAPPRRLRRHAARRDAGVDDPFGGLNLLLGHVTLPMSETVIDGLGNITGGTIGPLHIGAASANTTISPDSSGTLRLHLDAVRVDLDVGLVMNIGGAGGIEGHVTLNLDFTVHPEGNATMHPTAPDLPVRLAIPPDQCSSAGSSLSVSCPGFDFITCTIIQGALNAALLAGLVCTTVRDSLAGLDPTVAALSDTLLQAGGPPGPPVPPAAAEADITERWQGTLLDLSGDGGWFATVGPAVNAFFQPAVPGGPLPINALADELWRDYFPNAEAGVLNISLPDGVPLLSDDGLGVALLNVSIGKFNDVRAGRFLEEAGRFTSRNSITVGRVDLSVWVRVDVGDGTTLDTVLGMVLTDATFNFTAVTAIDADRWAATRQAGVAPLSVWDTLLGALGGAQRLLFPIAALNLTELSVAAGGASLKYRSALLRPAPPGAGGVDWLIGNASQLLGLWVPAVVGALPRVSQETLRPVLNTGVSSAVFVSHAAAEVSLAGAGGIADIPWDVWALVAFFSASVVAGGALGWYLCLRRGGGAVRARDDAAAEPRTEPRMSGSVYRSLPRSTGRWKTALDMEAARVSAGPSAALGSRCATFRDAGSLWDDIDAKTTVSTAAGGQRGDGQAEQRLRWLTQLDQVATEAVPAEERKEHAINWLYWRRFFTILRTGWDWLDTLLLIIILGFSCLTSYILTRALNELISSLTISSLIYLYGDEYGIRTPLPEVPYVGPAFPQSWAVSMCDLPADYLNTDLCNDIKRWAKGHCWGTGDASHQCWEQALGSECEKVEGQLSFDAGVGIWCFFWIGVWCVSVCIYLALAEYMSSRLRRKISYYLNSRIFSNRNLYRIVSLEPGIDNYDQRVCEDLEYLLQIGLGNLTGNYRNISSLQSAVWSLIWGFYYSAKNLTDAASTAISITYFFSVAGTIAIIFVIFTMLMSRISQIQFNQKWYEGNMRWVHSRCAAHCESICLYSGETRMEVRADKSFANVYSNFVRLSAFAGILGGVNSFFGNIASPFAYIFVVAAGIRAGQTLQSSSYFSSIISNSIAFMGAYQQLSMSGGCVHRVGAIIESLRAFEAEAATGQRPQAFATAEGRVAPSDGDAHAVSFGAVSVRAPWSTRGDLISDVSFALRAGGRMCVTGPTGSGKSAVVRALAGLWPPHAGVVSRPRAAGRGGIFVLPQRAYVFDGTLREQVLYPCGYGSRNETEEVEAALRRAELGDLLARWGVDAEEAWGDVLSGGELQRLAMARVLYQRPAVAVIDQATSALDVALEARMFAALREEGATVLSVVDRRSAIGHHSNVLRLAAPPAPGAAAVAADAAMPSPSPGGSARASLGRHRITAVSDADRAAAAEEARVAERVGYVHDDAAARPRRPTIPVEGTGPAFWRRLRYMMRLTFPTWTCRQSLYLYAACFARGLQGIGMIYGAKWGGEVIMGLLLRDGGNMVPLSDEWYTKYFGLWLVSLAGGVYQGYSSYCGMRCSLYMRAAVTNELHLRYFRPKVMYATNIVDDRIDTIDQRFVQDQALMVDYTQMFLFGGTVGSLGTLGVIPGVIRMAVCVWYAYTAMGWFAATATVIMTFVSCFFIVLASPFYARASLQLARAEGKYRAMHAACRGAAEGISLLGGEAAELARAGKLMDLGVYAARVRCVLAGIPLFIANLACGALATSAGPLLVSFAVFYVPSGAPAADDYTIALAFGLLFGPSLMELITAVAAVGFLGGLVNRVGQLLDACERQEDYDENLRGFLDHGGDEGGAGRGGGGGACIAVEGLSLTTPDGSRTLFRDMNFTVREGESLLIMGRSGCGKSSLLRVLGGLWAPDHGGRVTRPLRVGAGGYVFLPQRTFTTEGTLIEQVAFPAVDGVACQPTAQQAEELLDFVGLGVLVDEYGVDSSRAWDSVLSLGQLQRLGWARVFFHRPRLVIMDEATSSIDEETEALLMRRVAELAITCVTVAHRTSMIQYHKQVLRFDGNGGFELRPTLTTNDVAQPDIIA